MPKMLIDRPAAVVAASAIIDGAGAEHLTFQAVADRLGVSPGAVYHHIRDAADLRGAVASATIRELADVLVDAAVGLSGADAIEAMVDGWRSWATAHPARYELAAGSAAADVEAVTEAGRTLITLLARILERSGHPADEALHAARFLRSTIHGFVMLEISGAFVLDADIDETFAHLRRRLVDALSPATVRAAR